MKIIFNNSVNAIWFEWSGTRENLEAWLATANGFTEMVRLRQKSPVVVYVKKENLYIDIWTDLPGVEFVPQNIETVL